VKRKKKTYSKILKVQDVNLNLFLLLLLLFLFCFVSFCFVGLLVCLFVCLFAALEIFVQFIEYRIT